MQFPKTDYIFWYNTPMTNGSLSSPCKLYQGGRPAEKQNIDIQ